jgi:hypothetical protein
MTSSLSLIGVSAARTSRGLMCAEVGPADSGSGCAFRSSANCSLSTVGEGRSTCSARSQARTHAHAEVVLCRAIGPCSSRRERQRGKETARLSLSLSLSLSRARAREREREPCVIRLSRMGANRRGRKGRNGSAAPPCVRVLCVCV